LVQKVRETIRRHAMIERGMRVGIAVSGGADSVCLLHILRALAPSEGWSLEVLHFDHCLRGAESDADAAFVRDLARGMGLSCHLEKSDVAALSRASGDNLEQAAREARRDFYLRVLKSAGLDRIATGHTLSDQAETVLHRILRGAGLQGLCGILPITPEGIVRPLLEVSREEVRAWLRSEGLPWREDSTNDDLSLTRNRIRHALLPILAESVNPRVEAALARLASLALEDNRTLDGLARQLLDQCGISDGRAWIIDLKGLKRVPVSIRRRLLRLAILDASGGMRRLELDHLDAVLALCDAARGAGSVSLPCFDVERSFHYLRIGPPAPRWTQSETCLDPPFTVGPISVEPLPFENLPSPSALPEPACYDGCTYWLNGDLLPGPLILRNWQPGDAYQPAGHEEIRRLKYLFQSGKVPAWDRRNWPVILTGDQIVWARRFGVAAWAAAGTRQSLVIRVTDRDPKTLYPGAFLRPMNQSTPEMRLNK
jgi:tRNA(Ile)-lysidine synthase